MKTYKNLHSHLMQHHKKYFGWLFAGFAVVKTFVVLAWIFGLINLGATFAAPWWTRDISIFTTQLDNNIVDGAIVHYRINYYNNGTTGSENTQVSILLPQAVKLLSWTKQYTSIETWLNADAFGTSGDTCYAQFMEETWLYMDTFNAWAYDKAGIDIHTLLLNYPDPDVRNIYLWAPYNGELSMIGEFLNDLIPMLDTSFESLLTKTVWIDLSTLKGCWEGQKTKYTRDVGTLESGAFWEIIITTQIQNPKASDIVDLQPITTATNIYEQIENSGNNYSATLLDLPDDTNTVNHPIAISYKNNADQWVIFWPNNPAYSPTNSNAFILSGIINTWMTGKEKIIALRQFVKDTTFNYPNPSNKEWYPSWDGWSVIRYWNPTYFLNSLYGMCGEINRTLAELEKMAWFDSHLVGLSWHVIQEVFVDGARAMLDADGGVYRTWEDGHIYSVDELAADPTIMTNNPQDNNYDNSEYAEMISTTQDNNIQPIWDLPQEEIDKVLAIFLHPGDVIQYGYSLLGEWGNNGQINDGEWYLTHTLSPTQYTNVFWSDRWVTGKTETGFLYIENIPYLITTIDISLTTPTNKNVLVSINKENEWFTTIGKVNQRTTYNKINPKMRTTNTNKYTLKFTCDNCSWTDIDDVISHITIKNKFIFNTEILPYTGALKIYANIFSGTDLGTGITLAYNKDTTNTLRLNTTISGNIVETDTGNNTQTIELYPTVDYTAVLLPNDKEYTRDVLIRKGYTGETSTSLFSGLINENTLIGTSALSFLDTDTIRDNIIIQGDNVEVLLPVDTTVASNWAYCESNILLAPQDMTNEIKEIDPSITTAFKIGSPCSWTTLNFSTGIRMRIYTDKILGDTIGVKVSSDGTNREEINSTKINDHIIEIITDHFSFFSITSITTERPIPSGGNGGGPNLIKDQCPATRDCSDSYYDAICGKCSLIEKIINIIPFHWSADKPVASIANSKFSTELNDAYLRAYGYNITTMPTIQKANMEGKLMRKDMAKMISNFALNVLWKDISTWTTACTFTDMTSLSKETQYYAMSACRLWLMWYASDRVTINTNFNPDTEVDRGQFGTILSRLLRGDKNNSATNYYTNHLQALKDEGIMTKIETPSQKELRWRVMLMMQRTFDIVKK